jgi:ADP-heptose:LPS heptosyltransferase
VALFDQGVGPDRLLVIRLDNIGDMVMMTPALRALRAASPRARVTLMASPAGALVAPMLPWIDDLVVHRALWQELSPAPPDPDSQYELARTLRTAGHDASLIFTSFSQSPYPPAYACYLAGVPVRAGLSREFGGGVLSHWFRPPPDATHQVDRNLFLLESVGVPTAGSHLELSIPPEVEFEVEALLEERGIAPGEPYLVLAPAASCPARTYDIRRFAELAGILSARTGLALVVTGSARDRGTLSPLTGAHPSARIVPLVGETSVPALAAVIARAALLVTSHSGPMHLADAVGCPAVVLFSGTDLEQQWELRTSAARLLRRPTPCSPCYRFTCPYHMECLDISPGEIAAACLDLLETVAPGAPATLPASLPGKEPAWTPCVS